MKKKPIAKKSVAKKPAAFSVPIPPKQSVKECIGYVPKGVTLTVGDETLNGPQWYYLDGDGITYAFDTLYEVLMDVCFEDSKIADAILLRLMQEYAKAVK